MTRTHVSPWAIRGLYLLALVLVASPMMDLTTTVWPMRPGDMSWRYGFLGLTPGYLHTPILGLVLAMAVAFWQGHAGVLRWSGVLAQVIALVLLVAMAMFALDVVQMRAMRAPEVQSGILVGGALQEVKYLTATLVLVFLGLGGTRTAKELRRSAASAPQAPGIIRRDRADG